jgi:hypothetical protein
MSTSAIDTYRFITALKGTGKSANYTAEEIASAIDVSQRGSELLTKAEFDAAMVGVDARFARLDAKLDALRMEIKADVKASQVQLLMWLSGIVLASNGIVIALLGRLARVF